MVDFKEEKKALASKQDDLLKLLIDAEKRLVPFQLLSNELYDLVSNCDHDKVEMVSLVWFKAFLGYKDECMVLSKGELIRKYHIKQHKIYIHDREKERHFYNAQYKLSSLSRDGIDYEYRQILNTYPTKSMNNIATKSDEIGNRVDNLSKALDDSFRRLEEALKKRKINVDIILFHNGEQIRAKEEGVPLFNLLRGDMNTEKATKEQSLTTTLDEDFIRNCQGKSTNNLQGIKKRQNVIYDSDEDKIQEENEKKRLRRIEKEKRKEETNFQMDVSLDQLKSNRHADYENNMIVNESNTRYDNDDDDQWTIDPKLLPTKLLPLYKALYVLNNQIDASVQSRNNDVEVIDTNDAVDVDISVAPISRVRVRKNPFFEKKVSLDHVLRMRLYVSKEKYGLSYIDIGVCVNWNVCIEGSTPPARSELFVSCEDIFQYLFKYLLTVNLHNIIEYPSYIVVNDTKYSLGDKFNLPKDQNTIMRVYCYENDMASLCLTEIITMLRQKSNNDNTDSNSYNDTQFTHYLNSSFHLIGKMLMLFNNSTNIMNFNFDSMTSGLTGISSECLRILYDTIKRKDSTVIVNVSTNSTKIDSIALGITFIISSLQSLQSLQSLSSLL